jgi:FixJ family two-component response regulator
MDEKTVTCFVVDDDASVRQSLSFLLRSLRYRVETFDSADGFLSRDRYDGIGCIITDVKMPGMSGLDLQDTVGRGDNPLPIIFITGHGDLPMGVRAMKKGAVDFLAKPFDDEDLISAIAAALDKCRKARQASEDVTNAQNRFDKLSPREHDVLRHVISGRLNKQIAGELDIAEQTVKIHRGRIMKKLGVDSVAELVRLAEKAGIAHAP